MKTSGFLVTALASLAMGTAVSAKSPLSAESPAPDSQTQALVSNVLVEEVPTPTDVAALIREEYEYLQAIRDRGLIMTLPEIIKGLANGEIILDQIINIGEKIWDLVELGKPKVSVGFRYAHAMPEGIRTPNQLDNFTDMKFKSHRLTYQNLLGVKVFDITYTTVHQHGGSLVGQGQYLGNVTVLPSNLSVAWGYNVSVDVQEVGVFNMGTQEAPIAGLLLQMSTNVSTALKTEMTNTLFSFRGDSETVTMTSPN